MGAHQVSEQALDLRTTLAVLRRHRGMLAGAAVVGLAAGLAYSILRPPEFTSTSLVLLPPPTVATAGQSSTRDAATQVKIAQSDVVLGPAGASMEPKLTARQVANRISIGSPTNEIIQIRALGTAGDSAQRLSRAVADSYVTYVRQAASALDSTALAELRTRADTLRNQVNSLQEEGHATPPAAQDRTG